MRIPASAAMTGLLMLAPVTAFAQDMPVARDRSAAASTPADPQRLALASRIAAKVMPDGTYRRMMGEPMRQMMDRAMDSAGDMSLRDLEALGGLTPEETVKLGDGTLDEVMDLMDPAHQARTQAVITAMTDQMADLFSEAEPTMREGLAEAYAGRFDREELQKIADFFASPAGEKYAEQSMLIYTDPAILDRMQKIMPKLMHRMPEIAKTAQKAAADLPPPRSYDDLNAEERARLAKLLGITTEDLEAQHRSE